MRVTIVAVRSCNVRLLRTSTATCIAANGFWDRRGCLKRIMNTTAWGRLTLNVIDPAYDLADTILNLALSPEEEHNLITTIHCGIRGRCGGAAPFHAQTGRRPLDDEARPKSNSSIHRAAAMPSATPSALHERVELPDRANRAPLRLVLSPAGRIALACAARCAGRRRRHGPRIVRLSLYDRSRHRRRSRC